MCCILGLCWHVVKFLVFLSSYCIFPLTAFSRGHALSHCACTFRSQMTPSELAEKNPVKNHLDCRSSLSNRILHITLTRSNFRATKSPEGKLLGNKGSIRFCFSSRCCRCSCQPGHRVPVTPLGCTNRLISMCMHTRACLCLYSNHGHVMLIEVAPVRAGCSKERPCRFSP